MKIDLYGIIHKAQRMHMFALATKIGRTDLSDQQTLSSIEHELRAFIQHLRGHGHNEDTFIHPLFREVGDHAAGIDEEHDDLDKELDKLADFLDKKNWKELYSTFNRFIGIYLLHQDEEESLQREILWQHFENDRLAAVLDHFQASRAPAQRMEDLKFILPALSPNELTHIYQSMKSHLPALTAALAIAKQELAEDDYSHLCRSLG